MKINKISKVEIIYELIKELFNVPLQPFRVIYFMEKYGLFKLSYEDAVMFCDSLPNYI